MHGRMDNIFQVVAMTLKVKQFSWLTTLPLCFAACLLITPCMTTHLATFPLIPHHVQRARRLKEQGIDDNSNIQEPEKILRNHKLRRRLIEGVQMGAMYYGKGAHYVDLWCGTPPQRQTVIVDTGSAVTAFPCSVCTECGAGTYHINNAFEERNSSTFSIDSCDDCDNGECSEEGRCIIKTFYEETSYWTAFQARDRCYLGGPHNAPLLEEKETESIDPDHAKAVTIDLNFGCQTTVGGFFKTQLADGIMGMMDDGRSFWSQLYKSGKGGTSKQFSLCFSQPLQYNRTGTGAGAITLGGSDTRLHLSPMVFATRKNRNGHYKVHIRKIYLRHGQGGESARSIDTNAKIVSLDIKEELLNTGGVIVDSGTTDTYFNQAILAQFRAAFQELTGRKYDNKKWALKEDELGMLPTVLVQLEGEKGINKHLNPDPTQVIGLAGDLDPDHPYDVIIAIPPSHYMDWRSDGIYVPRIYDTPNGSVLGGNAITGHDVLFDMDRQVIGWAESHCDYQSLVTGNGYRDVLEGPLYKDVESYDSESDDDDDDDDEDSDSEDSESVETELAPNSNDSKAASKPSDSVLSMEVASPVSDGGSTESKQEKTEETEKKEDTTVASNLDSAPINEHSMSTFDTKNINDYGHEVPTGNALDLNSVSNHLDRAKNSISLMESMNVNPWDTVDGSLSWYYRGDVLVMLPTLLIFGRCFFRKIFGKPRAVTTKYKKLEQRDYHNNSQSFIADVSLDEEQKVCIELRRRAQQATSTKV